MELLVFADQQVSLTPRATDDQLEGVVTAVALRCNVTVNWFEVAARCGMADAYAARTHFYEVTAWDIGDSSESVDRMAVDMDITNSDMMFLSHLIDVMDVFDVDWDYVAEHCGMAGTLKARNYLNTCCRIGLLQAILL